MSATAVAPSVPLRPARAQLAGGALLAACGLLTILLLGRSSRADEDATWRLASGTSAIDVTLPVGATAFVLGALGVAAGAAYAVSASRRAARRAEIGLVAAGTVIALLTWAAAGQSFSFADLLQGTVDRSLPILIGALAGICCERVGVINVAIEGQLLAGAWAAALFATITSSLLVGLVSAAFAGMLVGALLAVFAIRYLVDQVVLGIVLNILVLGFTGFLYSGVMVQHQDSLNNPPVFGTIEVPLLSDLPVVGKALFEGSIFLFLAYALLAVVQLGLFRTRWGLRLRAVGEHPVAAATVAIRVRATRYRAVLVGGLIAGLGGAYFTIGGVGGFGKDIASGKGFIALAAVIFGRWRPFGALAAALLFGFMDALQALLATLDTPIPSRLLLMLPYVATIIVVAGFIGHARGPGAIGKPYVD